MARTIEVRAFAARIETRNNDDGTVGVRGYAAVFDAPAHGEVIKRSAFNRTLAQRDNVHLLVNHEGIPLASTKGGTMTLGVDERGLFFDVPSLDLNNPRVQELVSAMKRGDMDCCSFAFQALDAPKVDGIREVREAKLFDVSVVTVPWYDEPAAELTGAARGFDRELVEVRAAAEKRLRDGQMRARFDGKESFGDIAQKVCDAVCDMIEAAAGIEPSLWIEDLGADWAVYALWGGDDCDYYSIAYAIDGAGAVTLGDATQVRRITTWEPITPAEEAADDAADQAADNAGDLAAMGRSYSIAEARALLADLVTA
jgi:HK97 family phage prohead protease